MIRQRPVNPLLERTRRAPPRRVAVIGAGTIGPDIGYYLKTALPGLELVLVDVRQAAIDDALARLKGYADKARARGRMSESQASAALSGLTGSTDYDAIRGADWVLEAATEDLPLKRRIFADVESRIAPDAVITSNTSSLPASRIFAELAHPERATVTHFFAPAWRNPAVEVIDWERVDGDVVAWLRRLFAQTGKLPLLTADAPCFMLDRIFDNWCNEAGYLLAEASAAEVDSAVADLVAAGPFFVLNMSNGNPIIVETNTLQADEEGEHYRPAPVFRSVERWRTVALGKGVPMDDATRARIHDRMLGVLLSQSADILDRGIGSASDLDIGCRTALAFKRGPIEWLRTLDDAECRRIVERFQRERPGMPGFERAPSAYAAGERHVLVDDLDAGVKLITLRRPEALNALHDELTDEILAVIRRHESDPAVSGFVITGYGAKAFCAGADIGRFPSMLGDAGASERYARDCSRLLRHLDRSPKPVVAAIQGMALGGGFELAMRCHALVADRRAWFQLPEVTLGIVPGIGALVVPYRRWPTAAATFHAMLTRGAKLTASDAHALGIVNALADDFDHLLALAVAQVSALAARGREPLVDDPVQLPPFPQHDGKTVDGRVLSRTVVRIIEDAVRDGAAAASWDAALEAGYRAFGSVACTAAAREGIQAFLQRRSPDFGATG
jgi:enoyl-CoA hydratase/3-hydroxyacyl-CoA dehydrogenase